MSAKTLLAVMIGGTVAVLALGSRSRSAPEPPVVRRKVPEQPWLSAEAAAKVIGDGGALGPLFDGVELGGPAPSPRTRALIAAFARSNNVEIDLQISGGLLTAVRFDVTYGGCCGYEAADLLARRLARPYNGGGCFGEKIWLNDWATSNEDGTRMRAKVDVNHVSVRWEPELILPEVLARADRLMGGQADAVGKRAHERWISLERGQYLLELPYDFGGYREYAATAPDQLGFRVGVRANRISTIGFSVRDQSDDTKLLKQLKAHWGAPERKGESFVWSKPDRTITADVAGDTAYVSIAMR